MLIDSHAHLDNERYAEDRAAMLTRAFDAGIGTVLAIGIGEHALAMDGALKVCREFNPRAAAGERFPRLYASAGVYPHNTTEIDESVLAKLDAVLGEPEVIACGEIGMDYYHEGAPHETQREGLILQLEIAAVRKRPILIHCRPTADGAAGVMDAWDDLFLVLNDHWRQTGLGGVMHCFSAGWEQARRSIDLGFLISFAGNLTYPKTQGLRDTAAQVPLDSLLVETDAPWLTPTPDRGKRNEPAFVARTSELLARLKGVSGEEMTDATTKNFRRLFGLGPDVGN